MAQLMSLSEMKAKTAISVTGIVMGTSVYTRKKDNARFYSALLLIQGADSAMKVSIDSSLIDAESLDNPTPGIKQDELVTFRCIHQVYDNKLTLKAVSIVK